MSQLEGKDDPVPSALRRRIHDAARDELRRTPVATPWSRQAVRAVLAMVAFSGLTLVVALLAGIGPGERFADKALVLILLLVAQGLGFWSLAAPFSRPLLGAAVAATGAAGLGVALARAGAPVFAGDAPDWLCSVSHLAVDLVPGAVAIFLLRGAAWHPLRALTAGLAAGTLGLLVGEIGCQRSLAHLLVYHLGLWLAAAACLSIATRRLRPRSFAP